MNRGRPSIAPNCATASRSSEISLKGTRLDGEVRDKVENKLRIWLFLNADRPSSWACVSITAKYVDNIMPLPTGLFVITASGSFLKYSYRVHRSIGQSVNLKSVSRSVGRSVSRLVGPERILPCCCVTHCLRRGPRKDAMTEKRDRKQRKEKKDG